MHGNDSKNEHIFYTHNDDVFRMYVFRYILSKLTHVWAENLTFIEKEPLRWLVKLKIWRTKLKLSCDEKLKMYFGSNKRHWMK